MEFLTNYSSLLQPTLYALLTSCFQHCFYDGVFPQVWKHATILPLCKGRGNRSKPDSYRPISLCSSLGKLLEKVAHKQLVSFLNSNDRLHPSQHGFTKGKSTLTNLLQCDSHIAECLAKRHPFDIVTFDFCKAFDKASHRSVIEAAVDLGLHGKALLFISSFLSSRTQQVKVGSSLSKIVKVRSGVVQGSVLGPTLFVMLTNSTSLSSHLAPMQMTSSLSLTLEFTRVKKYKWKSIRSLLGLNSIICHFQWTSVVFCIMAITSLITVITSMGMSCPL
jgi:hypothetical protein